MKNAIERISMAARAILTEEMDWHGGMCNLDEAEGIAAILDKSPTDMFRAIADMVATGDDLSGLAERKAMTVQEWADAHRLLDGNGEPLEVGDLVRFGSVVASIKEFRRRAGGFQAYLPGKRRSPWFHVALLTKITTLTRKEYLPLARRTMDPDLNKKERLAMLAMGLIGETNEFLNSYGEDEIEEAGDVLWYAEQLLDEVGPPGPNTLHYDTDDPALWEVVKKAVFHGVDVDILGALAVDAIEAVEEVVVNDHGVLLGEVRAENIKKLMKRYPNGFVAGGGVR